MQYTINKHKPTASTNKPQFRIKRRQESCIKKSICIAEFLKTYHFKYRQVHNFNLENWAEEKDWSRHTTRQCPLQKAEA